MKAQIFYYLRIGFLWATVVYALALMAALGSMASAQAVTAGIVGCVLCVCYAVFNHLSSQNPY